MAHFVKLTCAESKREMFINLDMALTITDLNDTQTCITFGSSFLNVVGTTEAVLRAPAVDLDANGSERSRTLAPFDLAAGVKRMAGTR